MHKRAFTMRSVLQNVNAITANILPQSAECNARIKINTLYNIDYVKKQCTNAFIMRSVLHNVNAITASILPQNANCDATIRLKFCTTLLIQISNNVQILYLSWNNGNAITVIILPQNANCNAPHSCIIVHHKQCCAKH